MFNLGRTDLKNPAARITGVLVLGLLALLVSAGAALAATASSTYTAPRTFDTVNAQVSAKSVTAKRENGSIRVTLKGVSPTVAVSMLKAGNVRGSLSSSPGKLKRDWNRHFGFSPNITVAGAGGKAIFRRVNGTPIYNAKSKTIRFQVKATRNNSSAAGHAGTLSGSLKARVIPQQVIKPKQSRMRSTRQVTNQNCSSVSPAYANSDFCLAYVDTLGSGGGSWQNILSGTMQTVPTCQTVQSATKVGGDTTTAGSISIYETAAEAQQALSVSASVGYSSAVVSASASASFSDSSDSSTSSFYAIAQVNWSGGFVNFGNPTLTSSIYSEAEGITNMDDALNFLSYCGDSVPVGYSVGASWMSVLQITASSESSAQSISASLSGSYMGASASASFSQALSNSSSGLTISESDYCWGPSSCFSVPGYAAAANSNMSAALTQFTDNYDAMLTGLPNSCAPGADYAACITQVSYQPIYTLLPSSFSSTSPAALVGDAAAAAFAVQGNLNSWATGYTALSTGYPTNSDVSSWNSSTSAIAGQAQGCSKAYLGTSTSCVQAFENCWDALSANGSTVDSACLPSAFYSESLYDLANPWTLLPS
jgi:hypothetical protein